MQAMPKNEARMHPIRQIHILRPQKDRPSGRSQQNSFFSFYSYRRASMGSALAALEAG